MKKSAIVAVLFWGVLVLGCGKRNEVVVEKPVERVVFVDRPVEVERITHEHHGHGMVFGETEKAGENGIVIPKGKPILSLPVSIIASTENSVTIEATCTGTLCGKDDQSVEVFNVTEKDIVDVSTETPIAEGAFSGGTFNFTISPGDAKQEFWIVSTINPAAAFTDGENSKYFQIAIHEGGITAQDAVIKGAFPLKGITLWWERGVALGVKDCDIVTRDIATDAETNITATPFACEQYPAVSPDGTEVAYQMWDASTNTPNVFLSDRGGNAPVAVTMFRNDPVTSYYIQDIAFVSNDRIVFTLTSNISDFANGIVDWRADIHAVNTDGSGLVNLTGNEGLDYPDWSPAALDATHVVFSSARPTNASATKLLAVDVNTKEVVPFLVADDPMSAEYYPRVHPQAGVVFVSEKNIFNDATSSYTVEGGIFKADLDGNNKAKLTSYSFNPSDYLNFRRDIFPSFTADGGRVLFQRIEVSSVVFVMMNADGTMPREVPGLHQNVWNSISFLE